MGTDKIGYIHTGGTPSKTGPPASSVRAGGHDIHDKKYKITVLTCHLAIISSFAQKLAAAMLTAWLMTHARRRDTLPLSASNSSSAALQNEKTTRRNCFCFLLPRSAKTTPLLLPWDGRTDPRPSAFRECLSPPIESELILHSTARCTPELEPTRASAIEHESRTERLFAFHDVGEPD